MSNFQGEYTASKRTVYTKPSNPLSWHVASHTGCSLFKVGERIVHLLSHRGHPRCGRHGLVHAIIVPWDESALWGAKTGLHWGSRSVNGHGSRRRGTARLTHWSSHHYPADPNSWMASSYAHLLSSLGSPWASSWTKTRSRGRCAATSSALVHILEKGLPLGQLFVMPPDQLVLFHDLRL